MNDPLHPCVEALMSLAYGTGEECRWCKRFAGLDHASECPITLMAANLARPIGEKRTPDTLSEKPGLDAPEVVCLCGSTRFYEQFQQANYDLTMAGKIVLSVGFYPHSKTEHGHGEGVGHDSSEKVALDELHKRKIDLADRVLVLNVGGYIGQSTRGEIDYAIAHGKPVDYFEALGSTDSEGR